ncbi:hypothetical protein CLOHYLEM_05490 [[Clostridium] hylemonae DSM 15053]|uniref:Uncharacterized protein n=1 Tax=[Clostridium] hylemonae DSM 15053 TaxID=553973 RepID=C0C096_9FIRM|nr:hypothetical protein CLOHYLEM_05490 [[Clostridium] hylemonae DSM 15053]
MYRIIRIISSTGSAALYELLTSQILPAGGCPDFLAGSFFCLSLLYRIGIYIFIFRCYTQVYRH